MPFARLASATRLAAIGTLSSTLAIAGWAQQAPVAPTPQNTQEARPVPALNYSKPASHFPNPINPYLPRHVDAPNLSNTSRIDGLMHEGKLFSSVFVQLSIWS